MHNKNSSLRPYSNNSIPNDWKVKKGKEISEKITKGSSPKWQGFNYQDNGILFITSENVRDGYLDVSNPKYLPDLFNIKLKNSTLKKGDILINIVGASIGRSCIYDIDNSANINQAVCLFRVNNNYSREFISYFLQLPQSVDNLLNTQSDSARPNLTLEDIRNFNFFLPPLSEQHAIAKALSVMDTAINNHSQLIAQKELRKKWLMQNLLTGKKRLKGFSGEWKKEGAGNVFKSVSKKGNAEEELLSATQVRGIIPRTMLEGRVTMPSGNYSSFKLVEKGDFVISLRSFQGGLEYSYYKGLVSPAYTVLKPRKQINEEFYKHYFKSYDFIGHLAIAVIGIRDGKQISYDDFCTVKIPYPEVEEQTVIATVLQAADKEIALLKAKTEKLREQKKGMMQVLLTGKKRLKND